MVDSHLQRGRDAAVAVFEQIVAAVEVDGERPAVVTLPRLRRQHAMHAAHRMHSEANAVVVDAVEGEGGAQQPCETLDVVVGPSACDRVAIAWGRCRGDRGDAAGVGDTGRASRPHGTASPHWPLAHWAHWALRG